MYQSGAENIAVLLPTSCLGNIVEGSVTKLGYLLHFGQLFKACGNNYFAQIAHIIRQFCKGAEIFHFLVKSFLGNFYRHLATVYWSRWLKKQKIRVP